jgi:hypothetical protein
MVVSNESALAGLEMMMMMMMMMLFADYRSDVITAIFLPAN